jgi:ribonuclease P protein component
MKRTFQPNKRKRKKTHGFLVRMRTKGGQHIIKNLHLYKKGRRYRAKYFNLVYISSDLSFSRMAVVISKKVGNAVKRNKFKRQMRSLFRRNKDLLESSFDILIIAKKEIIDASWRKLQEDYFAAIRSIGQNR